MTVKPGHVYIYDKKRISITCKQFPWENNFFQTRVDEYSKPKYIGTNLPTHKVKLGTLVSYTEPNKKKTRKFGYVVMHKFFGTQSEYIIAPINKLEYNYRNDKIISEWCYGLSADQFLVVSEETCKYYEFHGVYKAHYSK